MDFSWSNVDHWRKLCPGLTISDVGYDDTPNECQDAEKNDLRHRLKEDGYALMDIECNEPSTRDLVAQAISELETKHSIPATFALLYDETWHLALQSQRCLLQQNSVLHPSMSFNFDVLAWHIDPNQNQVGFSPHRDRQPDTSEGLKQSFYEDGQAKYVTHWIALTDANPNNSCLYVIPKQLDPGYLGGDDLLDNSKEHLDNTSCKESENNADKDYDPLTRALPTKQSYQNIRALPRRPGQSIIFTHRILHWGSAGNPHYKASPRIAISFVYSNVEYEAPYLVNFDLNAKLPPFEIRLLLVCSQLLIYYQRFDLSTHYIRACYDYVKKHEKELNEVYCKKVFVEFVKAMKESRLEDEDEIYGLVDDDQGNKHGADSEEEDAMLEVMLNNEEEFEDDFDDLEYRENKKCKR